MNGGFSSSSCRHMALHWLQIEGLYSKYERTGGSSAFAVDRHANKAFVYWESKVSLH